MALLEERDRPRFVRVGDRFDEVTRVREITDGSVLLEDLETGATRSLELPDPGRSR